MALARRLPRSRLTMLRLRSPISTVPARLTPSVVMSLGLGLAVLVTITQIDGNLRRQFMAALPTARPRSISSISHRRGRPLRRVPESAGAAIDRRGRADAARAHHRRPRPSKRKTSSLRRTPNGCCRATAA